MSYNIAVAGKGGTGKTSLTGLLIDTLIHEDKKPILVVDADANANINEVLGVEVEATIGQIREEANMTEKRGNSFPGGMTKAQFLQWKLNSILVEGNGYDLLVMGRSEGEGCYCFVNGILREQVQKISGQYNYVITDNEAGMEHLSRKILREIDDLLLVSDCSARSIEAVARIRDLANEIGIKVGRTSLIVNKAPNGELNDGIRREIERFDLNLLGVVPMDEMIFEYDCNRRPLVELPEDSKAKIAVKEIFEKLNV